MTIKPDSIFERTHFVHECLLGKEICQGVGNKAKVNELKWNSRAGPVRLRERAGTVWLLIKEGPAD